MPSVTAGRFCRGRSVYRRMLLTLGRPTSLSQRSSFNASSVPITATCAAGNSRCPSDGSVLSDSSEGWMNNEHGRRMDVVPSATSGTSSQRTPTRRTSTNSDRQATAETPTTDGTSVENIDGQNAIPAFLREHSTFSHPSQVSITVCTLPDHGHDNVRDIAYSRLQGNAVTTPDVLVYDRLSNTKACSDCCRSRVL